MSVKGIDRAAVTAWFDANVAGARPPLDFELIPGGRSNLTYRVTDAAGRHYVLRRPPVSHVLPTAHDMGREHRLLSALAPTTVPVPTPLGYCPDPSVNQAPFFVMDYVDGMVVRTDADGEALPLETRRRAGESLVDALAELHRVDVDAVRLGDLSAKDGYIARQLKRWYAQYEGSRAQGGPDVAAIGKVHEILSGCIPEQQGASLVHGDYRLENAILSPAGDVRAILDWEICTLGDPLADVGLLMVYWTEAGDRFRALAEAPTARSGFPTRSELASRYASRTGYGLGPLDFYVAFGYWKLACVIAGVYARYAGGAGGGDEAGHRGMERQVQRLAEAAADLAGVVR